MGEHSPEKARQRGPVIRMRGRAITAREVGQPAWMARVIGTVDRPRSGHPAGMVFREQGVDVVEVNAEAAVRYVQAEIAAAQKRITQMEAQSRGLVKSITREKLRITALIGAPS